MTATTCADHTYGPDNYAAWHEWAEKKSKTHDQSKCDECGLYAIWSVRALGENPE